MLPSVDQCARQAGLWLHQRAWSLESKGWGLNPESVSAWWGALGQVTSCFSCLLVGVVRPTLPGVRRIQSPHVVSGKRLRWYLLAMTAVLSLQGAGGMDVLTLARQADGPAPSPSEPQGLDGLLSSSCLHLGLNTPSDGGSLLARGAWPVVNTISSVPSPNLCLVASTHRQR